MNPTQVKLTGLALLAIAAALSVAGIRALKGITTVHAVTTVRIERDQADLPELGARAATGVDLTFFMQTEAQLIESEAVLGKVVAKLDLNHVWGQRYADRQTFKSWESLRLLKARIRAQPVPNAMLLQIQASSGDAGEAVKLANTVAEVYCEYRAERRRQLAQTAIDALSGQYKTLEQAVRVAQEQVEAAKARLDPAMRENLPSAISATNNPTLRALRNRQSEATLRYMAMSNQLAASRQSGSALSGLTNQLQSRAEAAQAELLKVDAALRDELEKTEALRSYQNAHEEWAEADRVFAPAQKAMVELQAGLRPQEKPPAEITEPAATLAPDTAQASRGKALLLGGGIALAIGLVLRLFPTLVAAKS